MKMTAVVTLSLLAMLTACGGGDDSGNDYPQRASRTIALVNRNTAILNELKDITDPALRLPLVTEFNDNITTMASLKAAGGAESQDCGTGRINNDNAAERMGCHAKWDRAWTPLTA